MLPASSSSLYPLHLSPLLSSYFFPTSPDGDSMQASTRAASAHLALIWQQRVRRVTQEKGGVRMTRRGRVVVLLRLREMEEEGNERRMEKELQELTSFTAFSRNSWGLHRR